MVAKRTRKTTIFVKKAQTVEQANALLATIRMENKKHYLCVLRFITDDISNEFLQTLLPVIHSPLVDLQAELDLTEVNDPAFTQVEVADEISKAQA